MTLTEPSRYDGGLEIYLEAKGYELKKSGKEFISKVCPFCQDEKWHFYIDPEKKLYFCHKCNEKGNETTLRRRFNDLDNTMIISFKKAVGIKESTKPEPTEDRQYHQELFKVLAAMEFLKKRGLKESTIKHFKIGYEQRKEKGWITIPYYEDGKLVNIKYRTIPPEEKDFRRTKGAKVTLFNQDCITENHEIIITEGEFDAIMCWQSGFKNVISVPNGCSSFNSEWVDMLQNMEKIYLWYDNDEKGNKAIEGLIPRLGIDRCYIIRQEGYKDANEYFLCNQTLDLSLATQKKIDNVITFYDSVFKLFEHEKDLYSDIRTPWENVNRLVKSIEGGDLITLSATPKTGKTTFSLNIATYNAKRGFPVLVYCLEMRPERLAKKVIQAEGRITAENFTREMALATAQRLTDMPLYFAYNYKKVTSETVFQTIRASAARFGIKLLIFDNLHYLVRSLAHTTAEVGIISRSFKLLAEELRIPIILIAQPRKVEDGAVMTMNDLKDSSSIGADSDQVVILWRKKTLSSLVNGIEQVSSFDPKTLVRVDASRYTPGGDTVLMCMGEYSLFAEIEGERPIEQRGKDVYNY